MKPVVECFRRHFCLMISLFISLILIGSLGLAKEIKCHEDECQMKPEHFRLYSTVKRALDKNFNVKGKDLVSIIRSFEVLEKRFKPNQQPSKTLSVNNSNNNDKRQTSIALNGTEPVLRLLANERLREAMRVFNSDAGIQLVNLYRGSINGDQQNLACSKWRVSEIELAARMLEQNEILARVFTNIHKNFVERSARKCLKSSCGSIDDNMNRLDSVVRRSSRRKGFLAHDDSILSEAAATATATTASSTSLSDTSPGQQEETTGNSIEEALISLMENEPASEFQAEELELCKFFKRTNSTKCQASGNELNDITFITTPQHESKPASNETVAPSEHPPSGSNLASSSRNLSDYLADYQENRSPKDDTMPKEQVLAQCRAIKPVLGYHLFGLQWYQRQNLISAERLRTRTFWCPSLTYWFAIDRLCNELELMLPNANGGSFAY